MKTKFISCDKMHRYLRKMSEEFINIEFTQDKKKFDETDKTLILWNGESGMKFPNNPLHTFKTDLYHEWLDNGRPVYIMERANLPGFITIEKDKFGFGSKSYLREKWDKNLSDKQIEDTENYLLTLIKDDESLEKQNSERLNELEFFGTLRLQKSDYDQVVFIPMQLFDDTVIMMDSDWVEGVAKFQQYILQLIECNPNTLFLLKNHPLSKKYKWIFENENCKVVDGFHYKDCISYSDKMVCVNSGVGLQSMCWAVPCIVCGNAPYQQDGLNFKAHNYEELNKLLNSDLKVNYDTMIKFIYYLVFEFYCWCSTRVTGYNATEPTLYKRIMIDNKEVYRK